jgi:DNA replication protein DnaC
VRIIDDWALSPLTADQRNDILEILEDRYGPRSTIFASQLDAKRYHEYLGDPTMADAVCDRLIHNATESSYPDLPAERRKLRSSRTNQRRFAPIAMTELCEAMRRFR